MPKAGWWDVLKRTFQQIGEDNLSIVAAGVAFYIFVAAVPALAATVAIYALVSDPSAVTGHLESLAQVMPQSVMPLLDEQLNRLVSNNEAAGWGALVGIVIALYTASKATQATMYGLNIVYDERETRGIIKFYALSLVITLGAIIGVLLVIGLIAVLPAVLGAIGLSDAAATLLSLARWPILVVCFVVALAVLYRFGPSRDAPQWAWVSPGAIVATVLWIGGSVLFSLYVSNFADYNEVYGSLGVIVILLMWLYLSAFVVLLGAEFNSEAERQTAADTTQGEERPLGQRDAFAADTVGATAGETKREQEKEKRSREIEERRQRQREKS